MRSRHFRSKLIFSLLASSLLALGGSDASAQLQVYNPLTMGGTNGELWFGLSSDLSSDIDNDGINDLIVGSPRTDVISNGQTLSQAGKVSVYSGRDGHRIAVIYGTSPGELLGFSVAAIGDVNQDGYADLAAGAPEYSDSQFARKGRVILYSGRSLVSGGSSSSIACIKEGAGSEDLFGFNVKGFGRDVNSDGRTDWVVSAPGHLGANANASGYVDLFSGCTHIGTRSGQAGDHYGMTLAISEDINGDGRMDVAVGAPRANAGTGYIELLDGATGHRLAPIVRGAASNSFFGDAISTAGDINRSGAHDLIVAAPYYSNLNQGQINVGQTKVYSFNAMSSQLQVLPNLTKTGRHYVGYFGKSIATIGDAQRNGNARGFLAIFLGSPGEATVGADSGAGYLYDDSGVPFDRITGQGEGDKCGESATSGNAPLSMPGTVGMLVVSAPETAPAAGQTQNGPGYVDAFSAQPRRTGPPGLNILGNPCASGAHSPLTINGTNARLGQNFTVTITGAAPNTLVNLAYWRRLFTPVQIGTTSGQSCELLVDPQIVLYAMSDATGTATFNFPLPMDPWLSGLNFYFQAVSFGTPTLPTTITDVMTSALMEVVL